MYRLRVLSRHCSSIVATQRICCTTGPVLRRTYAAEAPDKAFSPEKVDMPSRNEIFAKITSSPAVMSATVSMIELMEKKGLNSKAMPTP